MGNSYLRKLLVVGAHAVLHHQARHDDPLRNWARKLLATKPFKLVAVATANKLARMRADKIPLAASGLMEAFKKLWPDAWGVRMEHVLRNSLYALLERDGSTLPDILRMYSDKAFRRGVVAGITNPVVRAFWKSEFVNYPPRYAAEALAPIQNKLGALLSDPMLYRVLVAPKVDLRFRQIMDDGRVLLVNLSKGQLGSDSSQTLGSLLVSTLGLAGLSRADADPSERRPFFLYVDEFQSFSTLSFANMMTELRKYGVGLTLAHQHLHQLEPEIRHAVLGNGKRCAEPTLSGMAVWAE